MRFEIDLFDTEVVSLLNRLVEITGINPWRKKFGTLQQQLHENQFLEELQLERHGIERKFGELIAEQERTRIFPVQIRDEQHYRLYAFAAGVVRIHEQLSPAGKTRLRGMLVDGLKPDNNLLSVQHEITTAVHLVSLGFDVKLNDIEVGSGVDFIARRDGAELEIECKMFTGDLGRKLHKRKVLMLHRHLFNAVERIYQSAQIGILLRVTIPDRLTCRPDQLAGIASAVSKGVLSGTAITQTPHCEVEVLDFPIRSSPFDIERPGDLSKQAIAEFVQARLGRTNTNFMVVFAPMKRALVALIESAKRDKVLDGIYHQLREASKGQFTKTRPGHLAIQFQDLTAEQMEGLARDGASDGGKPTGLQVMTSAFLQSPNRSHIHSVAYRAHGTVVRPESHPHAWMESGIGSFVRNPNHPQYEDARLRPLR